MDSLLLKYIFIPGYYLRLLLLPVIAYFLLYGNRKDINKGYSYFIKYYFARKEVHRYQKKHRILTKTLEDDFETEIDVPSLEHSNAQLFYGADEFGNNLSLSVIIGAEQIVELRLCLRLADGNAYTFPGGNNIFLTNLTKEQWKLKGLSIEVLEPFIRLRITFNGLLQNIGNQNFGKIEHLQFNFIFTCSASPSFIPEDMDSHLWNDALARNIWRDGSWKLNLPDQHGYDQFGAMRGYIKGDSYPTEHVINLPACRSKIRGMDDRLVLNRAMRFFLADEFGNLIYIVIKSFKEGCSQVNYGWIFKSNNVRLPLSGIDIRLEAIAAHETIPEVIAAEIKAQGHLFKCVINLDLEAYLKFVNTQEYFGHDCYNVPVECDINENQGKGIVELWYKKQGGKLYIPIPRLSDRIVKDLPDMLVSDIKSEFSQILDLTGGKGTSLALLASLDSKDFVVPDGCIVTVNAYRLQVASSPGLNQSLQLLNDVCCGKLDGKLEDECKGVIDKFKSVELLPEITRNISKYIEDHKDDTSCGWAVRSSAVGEDSEELSAAGQNDRFLGCITVDEVLNAVTACWASLFSSQSVRYRRQHGAAILTDMAVVIQKMVPADSAGVLFTCHPTTSNPSQMVITSNFGLGETVVSGISDPDTYILNRTWDNRITVRNQNRGKKNKVLRAAKNGLEEISSSGDIWSLSEEQALYLGKVGVVLEEAFGNSRDIEWAFCDSSLFLLQSRPITTLTAWSDVELTHEMDHPVITAHSCFTVANVKEVMHKAVTVLSQTSSVRSVNGALETFAQENYDPLTMKACPVFRHNVFIDVINGIHRNTTDEISVNSHILDLSIFGHLVLDEKLNYIILRRIGATTGWERLRQFLRVIRAILKNKENLKAATTLAKDVQRTLKVDNAAPLMVLEKIQVALQQVFDIAVYHAKTTTGCIFYQILTMNLLLEGGKELTSTHYSDFATILSTCDEVVSAEVPVYLERIAELIRISNKDEFCELDQAEGIQWIKKHCPEAHELLGDFLERHGHRSAGEFEIMEKSWADDPTRVISMIQVNVKHGRTIEKQKLNVEEVMQKLVSPKSSITRTILKFVMNKMRLTVGIREQTKSEMIRAINELRLAYRRLARRMVNSGMLPSEDLIYHLTHYEIRQVVERKNPLLITKAIRRQKLYPKWCSLEFCEINMGVPVPTNDTNDEAYSTSGVLTGTPASSGTVKGRACVLNNLSGISELQKGDILVTYSTDIAWSPYFPMVSGIVTELGGLVSHGAVVAREYGLPCIVGVQHARKCFKTGDIVLLNADKGEIGKIGAT